MGAVDQQAIKTAATWVRANVPQYLDGIYLERVARTGTGVYLLTFTGELSTLEQVSTLTPLGSDGTADMALVIVGGGPGFTQLEVHTFVGGNPADLDFEFLLEKVRTQDAD
jgi:hypothetical protein